MNVMKTVAALALTLAVGMLLGGRLQAQTQINYAVAGSAGLPSDVYPDSRERLPLPKREDMDDYGKTVFDRLALPATEQGGRSAASVKLYDPKLADPIEKAYHYLKFDDGLGDRLTQIAVLTTAREMRNQYEWTQWESVSWEPTQPAYVDPKIVDVIKNEKPVDGIGEREGAIITMARQLVAEPHHLTSAAFAHVLKDFGPRETLDLVDLMGLYMAAGTEITAFDLQHKPGQQPLLPADAITAGCSKPTM
jgi:4-carboxymuconolactone decarboxylase